MRTCSLLRSGGKLSPRTPRTAKRPCRTTGHASAAVAAVLDMGTAGDATDLPRKALVQAAFAGCSKKEAHCKSVRSTCWQVGTCWQRAPAANRSGAHAGRRAHAGNRHMLAMGTCWQVCLWQARSDVPE